MHVSSKPRSPCRRSSTPRTRRRWTPTWTPRGRASSSLPTTRAPKPTPRPTRGPSRRYSGAASASRSWSSPRWPSWAAPTRWRTSSTLGRARRGTRAGVPSRTTTGRRSTLKTCWWVFSCFYFLFSWTYIWDIPCAAYTSLRYIVI